MSAAVTSRQLCGCGCGNPVQGRRFLNDRHKQKYLAKLAEPVTYPHYISAELREVRCETHGKIFAEYLKTWPVRPGEGTGAAPMWTALDGCPECKAAENARLEALKPKETNPCATMKCDCPAPTCPTCGKKMKMTTAPVGWHDWACNDLGIYQDPIDPEHPPFNAPERQMVGSHKATTSTTWRTQ